MARKIGNKNVQRASPQVREIIELLGAGVMLSALFLFPGAGIGIASIYRAYKRAKRERDFQHWEKFNTPRLKFVLRRLHKQKLVRIRIEDGQEIVELTRKGKVKRLGYNLREMKIKRPEKWDGKWRLIIYDISKFKRRQQENLRRMLKKLHLIALQKSVYLTPYPCDKEVEFLREYFGVSEGVLYIVADRIENEEVYKRYFGL